MEKKLYIVTYDLKVTTRNYSGQKNRDYDSIHSRLEDYWSAVQLQQSAWLIATENTSAEKILNDLLRYSSISADDRLLVALIDNSDSLNYNPIVNSGYLE